MWIIIFVRKEILYSSYSFKYSFRQNNLKPGEEHVEKIDETYL